MFLRLLCEKFLWEGVRCDTSNRLLRNSSRDLLGGFRVASLMMSHELSSLTRIHVVSTGSHPKIPPYVRMTERNKLKKQDVNNKLLHQLVRSVIRTYGGILWRDPVLPTPHPPPRNSHFFLIFPWFLGICLLNQRIFGISGVPGGGG